eukprot:gene19693-21639_t
MRFLAYFIPKLQNTMMNTHVPDLDLHIRKQLSIFLNSRMVIGSDWPLMEGQWNMISLKVTKILQKKVTIKPIQIPNGAVAAAQQEHGNARESDDTFTQLLLPEDQLHWWL